MASGILLNAIDVPYTVSCMMPDNGLALLASCLLEAGHDVRVEDPGCVATLRDIVGQGERQELCAIHDEIRRGALCDALVSRMRAMDERVVQGLRGVYQRTFERIEQRVATREVGFLGIKLWMGAGCELALQMAARLAARHPSVKVFAGGPVATMAPRLLLERHPVLGGVCVGDGEEAVAALAAHCDGRGGLPGIPNLAYRDGSEIRLPAPSFTDLDSLPAPTYAADVYPGNDSGRLPIPCIDESRGCPMGCRFCAHSRMSGSRWRVREASRVVDEMQACRYALGARAFRFAGSYTPSKVYLAVAEQILARGEPTLYSGFAHIGGTRLADLPTLARSGLCALFFGLESGAPSLLSGPLGKNVEPEKAREVISACLRAGIFVSASVIFPSPGETEKTEAETLDLLTGLFAGREDASVPVQPAFPQPGSEWWERMEHFGFSGNRDELLEAICGLRVRHLLPASLWEPPPYGMDGHPIAHHARRTVAFARKLESRGIVTGMADEAALIGKAGGYAPRELHDLQRRIFVTADAEGLQEIIRRVRQCPGSAHGSTRLE